MSTSRGKTWLKAGISNTSSKVRPSPKNLELLVFCFKEVEFVAIGKDTLRDNMAKLDFVDGLPQIEIFHYFSLNKSVTS